MELEITLSKAEIGTPWPAPLLDFSDIETTKQSGGAPSASSDDIFPIPTLGTAAAAADGNGGGGGAEGGAVDGGTTTCTRVLTSNDEWGQERETGGNREMSAGGEASSGRGAEGVGAEVGDRAGLCLSVALWRCVYVCVFVCARVCVCVCDCVCVCV